MDNLINPVSVAAALGKTVKMTTAQIARAITLYTIGRHNTMCVRKKPTPRRRVKTQKKKYIYIK